MQKRLILAAITLLIAQAVIVAQKTSYDFEKTANFAAFKTYTMKPGTPVGQQLIDDRIVGAIDTQLAAKGLTKAAADPDVFVVYHMAFDKQQDISTYSSGEGAATARTGGAGAAAGRAAPRPPRCAKYSSARWSSTWPTQRRDSSCGAAWASRK